MPARAEEVVEIQRHTVYEKVPVTECWHHTGRPPIDTRWIDVNKCDTINPLYRSRLIAKEINTHKRDDIFAATPPLEAKKILFSAAVTDNLGWTGNKKMKLEFPDVRRAFFHADARRLVYAKLLAEDNAPGMCGKLLKSMYGTRDAPQNWEFALRSILTNLGFVRGRASPCVYYHEDRNVRMVIHGDDLTLLGHDADLDWCRQQIQQHLDIKVCGRLGSGPSDRNSIRI